MTATCREEHEQAVNGVDVAAEEIGHTTIQSGARGYIEEERAPFL
jgi:hypothetical protein